VKTVNQDTWNLSILYSSEHDPRISADLEAAQQRIGAWTQRYKGRVQNLTMTEARATMDEGYAISVQARRPVWFARLNFDLDTTNLEAKALLNRVQVISSDIHTELRAFDLEVGALPEAVFQTWLQSSELEIYHHDLQIVRRQHQFMLSEAEERILARKNLTGVTAWQQLYSEITSSIRIPFELDGELKDLTVDEARALRSRPERDVRERVSKAIHAAFAEREHVLTFIFNTLYQDHYLEMIETRHHAHVLEPTTMQDEITRADVEALFEATRANHGLVREFFEFKARALGIKDFKSFDFLAPIQGSQEKYPFAKSKDLVLEAFRRFDPGLLGIVEGFFEGRIDAYPRAGKYGGAYCWGSNPNDPAFILLNHNNRLDDVFTLAHELGHGIHTELLRSQPPVNYGHSTPLAETASIFSEMLLADLLLERADPTTKRMLLCELLEKAASTLYRQVMITRWEILAHEERAKGVVSSQRYGELWLEIYCDTFGDAMQPIPEDQWGWIAIPHVIRHRFYCYSYAFGMLLVLALYQRYKLEGANFVPKFKALLASGCSATPQELLARLEIDTRDPTFWQGGFDVIKGWLEELKVGENAKEGALVGSV
jgi:oligoendopeptidase F